MKKLLFVGALPLALGACATPLAPLPTVESQQKVASAAIPSPIRYTDPLAGFANRQVTGPRDWRSVNEEQSEANL